MASVDTSRSEQSNAEQAPLGIYGQSDMAARIRAFDWTTTSLGPVSAWPESLKSTVNLMLQSRLPMACYYGPDYAHLYNDAYATILGEKHPQSLGKNVLETWAENADAIRQQIDRVISGESWMDEGLHFRLDRGEGPEDVWFDLSYSPLIGPDLKPVGLFCVAQEVTRRVLSERAKNEAEASYAMALEAGNIVGTYAWDLDTGLAYSDANVNAMYGIVPQHSSEGVPSAEYFGKLYPPDLPQVEHTFSEARDQHRKVATEYRIVKPDGSLCWLYSAGQYQYDEQGRPRKFSGITIDTNAIKQIEAEKQRLIAIVETSQDFIAMAGMDGKLLYVNPAGLNMVGRETWQDTTIPDYIHPEDRAYVETVFIPELLKGGHFRQEIRILNHKTGEIVWILGNGIAIKEPKTGETVALATISPNITELKKAQDALREREERYRLLVEFGKVGLWDLDTETGVVYWNDYMYEMLGLPEDTRITQAIYLEKLHPDDVGRVMSLLQAHLDHNTPYSIEYRLQHSSGDYRYFLSRAESIRDEAGKPIRVMGIMMDITARKRAELENRKLLERERLIRGISELISHSFDTTYILSEAAHAIVSFFQMDRCLMVRYNHRSADALDLKCISQACAEQVSRVDEQTIPFKAFSALSPGRIPSHPQILDLCENPDEMPDYYRDFAVRWGIQSCIFVEIAYREQRYGRIILHQCRHPRQWEEDEIALLELLAIQLGAMLHQSELYQAEQVAKQQAESASQQKSQFLANMSHEFRTPLNAILGFSGLIARGKGGPLTPKQEKFIGNVLSSGQHMLAIVNDILDLSKVEAGQMTLELQEVDISALFGELSAMFEHMAESRGVSIQLELKPGTERIQADPVRLRQILQNLIANAIKFNHAGGSVHVTSWLEEGVFHCQVRDTGIGIAPADLGRLFSVFTQLDDGFSRKEEGSGLGLALTKRLVELHGGTLNVESKPEAGSTFGFTIPQSGSIPKRV